MMTKNDNRKVNLFVENFVKSFFFFVGKLSFEDFNELLTQPQTNQCEFMFG
jgi:hypothetical protein